MVRNRVGGLCGYVGVPGGHPFHGKGYDDLPVVVHGGLTFADRCADLSREVWEKRRAALPTLRAEAEKYPRGDAAEHLRELEPVIDSYEAWREATQARAICHIPGDGEPDNVWWLGFDCVHYGDLAPKMPKMNATLGGHDVRDYETYRDLAYVRAEVASLARQLSEVR
jgi:hypothetical protein